jgi:hypothetical protein
MSKVVEGGSVPFKEEDKCPSGLRGVWTEAKAADINQAIERKDEWEDQVGTWLGSASEKDGSEVWSFFWDEIGNRQVTENLGKLIFLLCCCREVFSVRWVFKGANRQIVDLISACNALVLALENIDAQISKPFMEAILRSVSKGVQDNVNHQPGTLPLITSECRWAMEGSLIRLDDYVTVDLVVLLNQVPTTELFEYMKMCLKDAKDDKSREQFKSACQDVIRKQWSQIRDGLLVKWMEIASSSNREADGKEFLEFYSVAGNDELFYELAREKIGTVLEFRGDDTKTISVPLDLWCAMLGSNLCSSHSADRTLLDILREHITSTKNMSIYVVILDRLWEEPENKDSSLLLCLLWMEYQSFPDRRDDTRRLTALTKTLKILERRFKTKDIDASVLFVLRHLGELFNGHFRHLPNEREAWRIQLVEYVISKSYLHLPVLETLLWFSNENTIDDAELAILDLINKGLDSSLLSALSTHPSAAVQRRVKAIQHLIDETEGPSTLEFRTQDRHSLIETVNEIRGLSTHPEDRHTWMGNRELEALLLRTISNTERKFCLEYDQHWQSDEEQLTSRLFNTMEAEFSKIKPIVSDFVRHKLISPVTIDLKYRQVSKQEEGGKGIGTETLGADLMFLVNVEERRTLVTRRASFIQCKKLFRTKKQTAWETSFKIQRKQRDDLIDQSESSFYLFFVPPVVQEECWILQARLVKTLMQLNQSQTTLPKAIAYQASRSLATWMTYDLLGLWVGDERADFVNVAGGLGDGKKPYGMVEISVKFGNNE